MFCLKKLELVSSDCFNLCRNDDKGGVISGNLFYIDISDNYVCQKLNSKI